ncbi:unnamed protein product, partial [Schistosoma margrebowiei]
LACTCSKCTTRCDRSPARAAADSQPSVVKAKFSLDICLIVIGSPVIGA